MTFVIGDIHGKWELVFAALDRNLIENCEVICVGDIGMGFKAHQSQLHEIELLNNRFKKRNIVFYSIRGNHDDPQYFDGSIDLSNFKLLSDYSSLHIDNYHLFLVGGAVSIDRAVRSPGKSWWVDETCFFDEKLCKQCDILITHSAPMWSGPNDKQGISYWTDRDTLLWEDCVAERVVHNKLIEICKPSRHFCGHFHLSKFTENKDLNVVSVILNELEIKQIL